MNPSLSIFAASLVLRVGFLTLTGRSLARPDTFAFGWETGRIAQALVAGRGFADPFDAATGATSWLAPLYPLILAGIFKVFGPHSPASAFATLTFSAACSAATAVLIYKVGTEILGEGHGRRAGWAWALFPMRSPGPPASSGTRASPQLSWPGCSFSRSAWVDRVPWGAGSPSEGPGGSSP